MNLKITFRASSLVLSPLMENIFASNAYIIQDHSIIITKNITNLYYNLCILLTINLVKLICTFENSICGQAFYKHLNFPTDSCLFNTYVQLHYVFVGNKAYSLLYHLMRPYRDGSANTNSKFWYYNKRFLGYVEQLNVHLTLLILSGEL